jgi:hypothetical protein
VSSERGISKHIYGRSLPKGKPEGSLPYVVAKPKFTTDGATSTEGGRERKGRGRGEIGGWSVGIFFD